MEIEELDKLDVYQMTDELLKLPRAERQKYREYVILRLAKEFEKLMYGDDELLE